MKMVFHLVLGLLLLLLLPASVISHDLSGKDHKNDNNGKCSALLAATMEQQDYNEECMMVCEYQYEDCNDDSYLDDIGGGWNLVKECDDKEDQDPEAVRMLSTDAPDPCFVANSLQNRRKILDATDECYLSEFAMTLMNPKAKSYTTNRYPHICCNVDDDQDNIRFRLRHQRSLVKCDVDDNTGNTDPCFSAATLIQEEKKGVIAMSDLQVGDKIMTTKAGDYETVYAFGHYLQQAKGTFLQIHLSWNHTSSLFGRSEDILEVSEEHLLYLQGLHNPIRADAVKVGHVLEGGGQVSVIESITRADGLFAPLTSTGQIFVNGVQASSYISLQPETEFVKFQGDHHLLSYHDFIHIVLSPYRMYCSTKAGLCIPDTYNENGMPPSIALGIDLFHTLDAMDLPLWLQLMHFALAVSIGLCFMALEYILAVMSGIYAANAAVATAMLSTLSLAFLVKKIINSKA